MFSLNWQWYKNWLSCLSNITLGTFVSERKKKDFCFYFIFFFLLLHCTVLIGHLVFPSSVAPGCSRKWIAPKFKASSSPGSDNSPKGGQLATPLPSVPMGQPRYRNSPSALWTYWDLAQGCYHAEGCTGEISLLQWSSSRSVTILQNILIKESDCLVMAGWTGSLWPCQKCLA